MAPDTINNAGGPVNFGAAQPIARSLLWLRAAARRRLVVERGAALLALVVIVVLGAAVVDFVFRLPALLRGAALVFGIFTLIGTAARVLWPAIRFAPSLVEVALRVERSPAGQEAGLSGRLASGLELGMNLAKVGRPQAQNSELAAAAVADTVTRFQSVRAGAALLTSARAQRGMLALAAALLPVLVAFWGVPEYARLGLVRVTMPWLDVSWPKRTMIVADMGEVAHPIDTPLALRAVVTRSNQTPGMTNVTAIYRVLTAGEPGPETRMLLNPPRRPGAARSPGELDAYEAIVAREQLGLQSGISGSGTPANRVLEVRFETPDDSTPKLSVILVERPRILTAKATVTPPQYAAGVATVASGPSDLSVDRSRPAAVGPVLAGSQVELTLNLNKPVPTPDMPETSEPKVDRTAWLRSTFGEGAEGAGSLPRDATLELAPDRWVVRWTAGESGAVKVLPSDSFGIAASDEAVFTFAVAADAPPTAVVLDPPSDEAVLPTAILNTTGEGRDDVGLGSVKLQGQRQSPPPGSSGAVPEPVGDAVEMKAIQTSTAGEISARVTTELDLSTFGVQPGDELWLTAIVTDRFAIGAQTHEAVRSLPRKLRIISEAQLVEQVMSDLAPLRPAAERLDQDQAAISKRTDELSKPGADRSQAAQAAQQEKSLADRLAPASDLVRRAKDRVERNAVSDRSLRDMLEQAQTLVNDAAEAARNASEAMKEIGSTPGEQPVSPQTSDEIRKEQGEVRENLEKLADLVAQGQDGWAARQSVERLLNDQRALTEQTKQAGERAAGQEKDQLPQDVQAELDRLARQQQDLSRRAEQAAQNLAERAQKSKQSDPAQSAGLERAAQKAQKEQLQDTMQQAAQDVQQNQTGKANQAQQQSEKTLEEMLKEIDSSQKRRDEALKRVLTDLMQSIEKLITEQENQIAALASAIDSGNFEGLGRALASLRANTLGVADNAEVREVAEIVQRLSAAADHQDTAGANLKPPADAVVADENERMSLKRLQEAKELAKTLQDEAEKRDEDRKRAELLQAYREVLDAQVKVTDDTIPLVGKELSRRDRGMVRGLGARQTEVREKLNKIREETPEIAQAEMFDYAHGQLDLVTSRAAKVLSEGEATTLVARDQTEAVELLKAIAGALAEATKKDQEPFRKNEGGEGGSGGGGNQNAQAQGAIPPALQLQVLRAVQQRLARQTREASESAKPDLALIDEIGAKQKELAERGQKVVDAVKKMPGMNADPKKPEDDKNDGGEKPGGGGT
ncbi:MAG: hypothetical protein AABZ53_10855 [Planctomycetota bacterium]